MTSTITADHTWLRRSQLKTLPVYFDRYINKNDDVTILEAIQNSIKELDNIPVWKWVTLGNKVYAPGKWTLRDIVQHLIDTERIFMFRALAIARSEKQALPSFEEDAYAAQAMAVNRDIHGLIAELKILHQSVLSMYQSFTPDMLQKKGMGWKGPYSVADIGFILPGHQRWHLQVLEHKYYPLLAKL